MSGYSIAIRTLGRAGEKYQKLLDSVACSLVQPDKIIVVLPEGFVLPKERLGYEEFVFCSKSMVGQRLEALKYIDSEYTLFLDDDVSFSSDFVSKLMKPLDNGLFDCATGPLFSFFPASTAGVIAGTLTSSVSISVFNRDMYVKILRSGGWSYHTFNTDEERYYPTDSFAWTCFMIRTKTMRDLNMEDEIPWLEKNGYAYGDDRVMAYKLVKRGYRACIVANAGYNHHDAKTSTASEEMNSIKPVYCKGFFQIIFWRRYIQDLEKTKLMRGINACCIGYWVVSMIGYHGLKAMLSHNYWPSLKAFYRGVIDGIAFIHSEEYRELRTVI